MRSKKVIWVFGMVSILFMFLAMDAFGEKSGGWLKYPLPAEPRPIDPQHHFNEKNSNFISMHIYENLIGINKDLKFIPELATSWKMAPDGRSCEFQLRKGVKFHDGTPFDAKAVEANFNRFPQQRPNTFKFVDVWFKSLDVLDDYSVRINLKKVYAPFLSEMAQIYMRMLSPKAIKKYGVNELGRHPSGTGPWQFVEWISGDNLRVKRFDDYWRGKPLLDGIIFKFTPDGTSRMMGFESGSFDVLRQPQYTDIERLEKSGKFVSISQPSSEILHFAFNCLREPFGNKDVRTAINHAINRELIVKSLLGGNVIVANGVGPVWLKDSVFSEKAFAYNPGKSKEILRNMGWKPGPDGILMTDGKRFEFKIMTPNGRYPMDKQISEAIQSELKKIGIASSLEVVEGARFIKWLRSPCSTRAASPIGMVCRTRPLGASLEFALVQHYHSDFGPPLSNSGCYSNKEVDKALEDARSILDDKKRFETYKRAQEAIFIDAPITPVYYYRSYMFAQKWVKNVDLFPPAYSPCPWISHKTWMDK